MSMIKKIRQKLAGILGRSPTIHEEIDYVIWEECKERALELQFAYQMNPNENYKEAFNHAVRCLGEIQDRNPDIFVYQDDDGSNDEDF